MQNTTANGLTRRGLLRAFAATTVVAAPTYANAFGFLRGAGDIRKISIYSSRTGETLESIYWIEGNYIPEAMSEINRIMRDWRSGEVTRIDARTIDIMAASHSLLRPRALHAPVRLPLARDQRHASEPVGRRGANSLHMKGQAADLRLKSRSVAQMARAAAACNAGGVGKYSRSNFVHMDCGPVRVWGG
jgi:uncharacterized protein YcbK (DUF882 family)